LRSSGGVTVEVDGAPVSLEPDELIVTETPRSGWAVISANGETVALDLAITPQLRRLGLAREVVRLIQDARKNDGLDVSDRIELRWSTSDPELSAALTEHGDVIAREVLAATFAAAAGTLDPGLHEHRDAELGLTFWLGRLNPDR